MELIERYLKSVKSILPRQQGDDIAAELSDDIHAEIEERRAGLGRELIEVEVEALLKQRGRPELVAIRFLPAESPTILLPVHRFVLKVVFFCYLAPWLLAYLVWWALEQPRPSIWSAIGSLSAQMWLATFLALGTVKLIFAARRKWIEDWTPRKIPR